MSPPNSADQTLYTIQGNLNGTPLMDTGCIEDEKTGTISSIAFGYHANIGNAGAFLRTTEFNNPTNPSLLIDVHGNLDVTHAVNTNFSKISQ